MSRPGWHTFFMRQAVIAATRATCDRRHVGAVLVRHNRILATGYNGSIRKLRHCNEGGHLMVDGHCVAGSTVVSKLQTGDYNSGHRTVEQIWEAWQDDRKRGAMRRMKVRTAGHDGVLAAGNITDVWRSDAKQQCFEVRTLLGRSVEVTSEHKFLTPGGWSPLDRLEQGDRVALNGQPLHEDSSWLRQKYEVEGRTQLQLASLAGCGRTTISRSLDKFGIARRPFKLGGWNRGHRRSGPQYGGRDVSLTAARMRARRYALADECAVCCSADRLQVHHLDGDAFNDADANLCTLCTPCHNLAHTPHAKRESVVFDQIVSIVPTTNQYVYDLTVEPHHNFVGDGFILHNCVRTIHAEANALLAATRHGVSTDGATLYVTCYPCWACFKLLAQAGIKSIIYENSYRVDPLVADAAMGMGITLGQHPLGKEDMDRLTAEIDYDPDEEGRDPDEEDEEEGGGL